MNIQPIVLAGGKGKRMGNPELPKVLCPLNGKPIISYLLDTLKKSAFLPPTLVVGHKQELVREAFGPSYTYVFQEEQLGTGHAVLVTQEALEHHADAFLVLAGDQPLWSLATMERLVAEHEKTGATISIATIVSPDPIFNDFGRVLRNELGEIIAFRELKDCTEEEKAIQEYNPTMYCVNDAWLWKALAKIRPENAQAEYYLTDLVSIAVSEGLKVASVQAEDAFEVIGINNPQQLEEVAERIK